MAKLLALALAFTAFVAFCTAHTTIVTTTIEETNPRSQQDQQQCRQQVQDQSFNQCKSYLQQEQNLQGCCQELQRVDEKCQCVAVEQAFEQAQRQHQQRQRQQGERSSSEMIPKLMPRAQQLPDKCNLQQCQMTRPIITTTTTALEDDYSRSRQSSPGSQQCSQVQGRQFNQCLTYIERAQQSGYILMRHTDIQGQQEVEELQLQCCNELENVQRDCQCEAMQEVYDQAMKKMQQPKTRAQTGLRRSQQQQMEQMVQRMVQNLSNQCNLDVQQCRIPSTMF